MPNRPIERINRRIGDYEIATYSKTYGDLTRIIEEPNESSLVGIIVADTVGHNKKLRNIFSRRIQQIEKKFSPPWYSYENTFESVKTLSNQLDLNKSRVKKTNQDINNSYILYGQIKENSLHYNRSISPPMYVNQKGEITIIKEGNTSPLGFVNYFKEGELAKISLETGESIIIYTDGLIENPWICKKAKDKIEKIENRKKEEFSQKLGKLPNIEEDEKAYQKDLMKIVEEYPNKSIEELKTIIKKKVEKKYVPIPTNKGIQNTLKDESKNIKDKIAKEIRRVEVETRSEFDNKFINTIKQNYKKSPKKIIEEILKLKEYFDPTEEHHDDVTIIILKKVK
jgi:hypothetical protein